MSINLTDEIEVKTKKGKLGAAKQIFLEGDTQTVENEIQNINSRHNDLNSKHESLSSTVSEHTNQIESNQNQIIANKSTQDAKNASLDANMAELNTRDDQITELVRGITATGGASVATTVTYDNTSSHLVSATVQGAIDELQGSKIDKTSILQKLGNAEDKVMSQNVVSDALSTKVDKTDITQSTGTSTTSVMSQKAVSDSINKLKNAGYLYAGIAIPTTNPDTPDGPVFYLATQPGTYSNFEGIEVLEGESVILQWANSTWAKKITGFAVQYETDIIKNFDTSFQKNVLFLELLRISPLAFANICTKNGYYISNFLDWAEDDRYRSTEKIFVKKGTTINFVLANGNTTSILRIAEWDIDGNAIGNTDNVSEYTALNDCFIAFSLLIDTLSDKYVKGNFANIKDTVDTIGKIVSNTEYLVKTIGNGSKISLPSSIDFNTVGDYIEWQCKNIGTKPYDSTNIGMILGDKTAAGLYLNNKFYFRSNSNSGSDYIKWQIDYDFNAAMLHKYKILNTKEGWELFIDDVSYGKKAISENANVLTIGNSTALTEFVFKSFAAHSSISGDILYNAPALYEFASGAIALVPDVANLEFSVANLESNVATFSKIYKDKYYSAYNEAEDKYSFTKVSNPLTLAEIGDYVEITCRVRDISKNYMYTMNLLNKEDYPESSTRFGWFNNTEIWLRLSGNVFTKWTNLPRNSGWKKIKLAVVEEGWELFIDDISYGTREKSNNFPIVMIGATSTVNPPNSGMKPQLYDIQSCYVHTSKGNYDYSPLGLYAGSVNVEMHEADKANLDSQNPLCFVSYNSSQKRFKIYMRDKQNQQTYYMVSVYLNSTVGTKNEAIAYSHFWEIDNQSYKCTYDPSSGIMIEDENIIAGGESECVFMYSDPSGNSKADHTGGVHGDERIDISSDSFINFYIDGVKLTETELLTDFTLRECNSFQYIQNSTLHDTAISVPNKETIVEATGDGVLSLDPETNNFLIDGVDTGIIAYSANTLMSNSELSSLSLSKSETNKWVISKVIELISGHPIIGTHIKKTTIANQKYRTENILNFNSVRKVTYWYHGICCISKNCAKIGHTEAYKDHEFTGDNAQYLRQKGFRMFEAYNADKKLSARITSSITDGGGVIDDANCDVFIWDRVNDSKYYRQTASFNPEIDKRLVSVMEVQFGTTEY